jgi:HAT1-interacting factor 1
MPFVVIRVAHHGELAPECVSTYFKYGCALLYKAQDEADPLGNVPKSSSNKESMKSTTNKDDSGSSKTPGSNTEDAPSTDKADAEEGCYCTIINDGHTPCAFLPGFCGKY